MVRFGELHPDGTISDERDIPQEQIKACPHLIMMPEHYRGDDRCRCDDPEHTEMREWEYTWDGERWT